MLSVSLDWGNFHRVMSQLKLVAPTNLEKGQRVAVWCNSIARTDILVALAALETSHDEMSWLKLVALLNTLPISVTLETTHRDTSPLNATVFSNLPRQTHQGCTHA